MMMRSLGKAYSVLTPVRCVATVLLHPVLTYAFTFPGCILPVSGHVRATKVNKQCITGSAKIIHVCKLCPVRCSSISSILSEIILFLEVFLCVSAFRDGFYLVKALIKAA